MTPEEMGDRVRSALGAAAHLVEEVAVRSTTAPAGLPPEARARLAIRPDEVNVLLRVVLRDLGGTVPGPVANDLRDRIYQALHHS
jgi:phenylalanyl-tRNA synthetase alpha chain